MVVAVGQATERGRAHLQASHARSRKPPLPRPGAGPAVSLVPGLIARCVEIQQKIAAVVVTVVDDEDQR
jgi:hypothetical protein